jgi:predicted MFS family arabinose efflux permease
LVLALDYADRAGVGALGPDLKHAFEISNTEFGLLASAFSAVGALATIPAGILTDRVRRTIVLAVAVALWGVAMGATGAATSFMFLVVARVFLGVVTATARPAIFSISGDVFATRVRGRALGIIGTGEIVGDGIGFLLAGAIAALFSWRSSSSSSAWPGSRSSGCSGGCRSRRAGPATRSRTPPPMPVPRRRKT